MSKRSNFLEGFQRAAGGGIAVPGKIVNGLVRATRNYESGVGAT